MNYTYDCTINLYINLRCRDQNYIHTSNSKTFATSNYIQT